MWLVLRHLLLFRPMHLPRLVPGWLLVGLGVSAGWFVPARAEACSCVPGSTLVWPSAGAADVPLDASIVISGFGGFAQQPDLFLVAPEADAGARPLSGDLDGGPSEVAPSPSADGGAASPAHPPGLHLVGPNQDIVQLAQKRTLPTVDCTSSYAFYGLVAGDLQPATTYRLHEGETLVASFTTGSERRDLEAEKVAAQALKVELLASSADPSRIATAFVSNVQSRLFIHYVGSQEEVTYDLSQVAGDGAVGVYALGSVQCPEFEFIGLDGQTVDTRRLCEATRCATLDGTVSVSSCGGNYSVGVDYPTFQALPVGCETLGGSQPLPGASSSTPNSSEAPAVSSGVSPASTEPSIAPQPEPRKVPLDGPSSEQASEGCSTRAPGVGSSRMFAWALAIAVGGTVRRRVRRLDLSRKPL